MSRIDTALKPRVENSSSAALRIASRMLGFRVMIFCSRDLLSARLSLYVCTNNKVRSTNIWNRRGPALPPLPCREFWDARDHRCIADRRRRAGVARDTGHRGRPGTAPGPGADGCAAGRTLYGHADLDPAGDERRS